MNRIINFHDINDKNWLEPILLYLKSKYRMISAADLESFINGNDKSERFCHITVDDGDKTFYDVVYPLLKKYNIPATLFVSPKIITEQSNYWFQDVKDFNDLNIRKTIAEYIGVDIEEIRRYEIMHIFKALRFYQIKEIIEIYKSQYFSKTGDSRNLNIRQLQEINNEGLVSIGAHTLNHPILFNEDDATCKSEIIESFNNLSDLIGCDIRYFAYPNGIPELDFGEREKGFLIEAGCRLAFSTFHGITKNSSDFLSIPRYYVSKGSLQSVKIKLFMGEHWNKLRNLKTKSEKQSRAELKSILKVTL